MLEKLNRFSFSVTTPSFAKGGAVVGTLQDSTTAPNITFGLICSEWCEWLPALPFVPVIPLWIWCHSIRWCKILAKVFPHVTFVDGFTTPLPAVDVLLLSRVTLGQCNILLKHCPVSLILSSSRLKCVLGWVSKFWKLSHAQVGGCSDGSWIIYSVHRLGYLDPAPLSQSISLPVGSVHRVIDARAGNGRPVSCPSEDSVSTSGISCHTLFPLRNPFARFVVPSAFSSTGWCLRTLTIQEKLALRDCSADLIKSLSVAQQRILWHWEGVPSRVLGFLLRFMLTFSGTGGGEGKGVTNFKHVRC